MAKKLHKLSNKRLDELEDRLNSRLRAGTCCTPLYRRRMKALWHIMNERLRRIGL